MTKFPFKFGSQGGIVRVLRRPPGRPTLSGVQTRRYAPHRPYLHASQRFKVTKARISQLMKIAYALPQEFVEYTGRCEDKNLIKRFSGKNLLRIAGIEPPDQRKEVVDQLMEKIELNDN